MKITQADRIMHHLRSRRTINVPEAQTLYNVWRLAAVISTIRKEHVIDAGVMPGSKCRFAEYSYVRPIEKQGDLL
jgi:hypothetical protein